MKTRIPPKILTVVLAVMCVAFFNLSVSRAALMYADHVTNLLKGDTTIGDFPTFEGSFYGGNYPGIFPVPLSDIQAEAAVLGAPDGAFLSLPGATGTPSGTAWPYAYVEVGFASTFTPSDVLEITELGKSWESAHIWVWGTGGGNGQFEVTRGDDDTLVVDLSSLIGIDFLASLDRVGIGGLDELGGSKGFDLDAVAVNSVPEPSTLFLLGVGLLGIAGYRRKFRQQ